MEQVKEKWPGYWIPMLPCIPGEIDAAGCVTGKPVTQGGVRGRKEATGLGVFYGLSEVCNMPSVMDKLGLTTRCKGKTGLCTGTG